MFALTFKVLVTHHSTKTEEIAARYVAGDILEQPPEAGVDVFGTVNENCDQLMPVHMNSYLTFGHVKALSSMPLQTL